jgi:hypothetical protein
VSDFEKFLAVVGGLACAGSLFAVVCVAGEWLGSVVRRVLRERREEEERWRGRRKPL